MKIMMVGDSHGDLRNLVHKIEWAKKVGDIQRIVVLGDFGLWWGHEGVVFLDDLNSLAKHANLQIFAVPGNHENHELWSALVENSATSHGWAYARSHVLLSPKVHMFTWNNVNFAVAGGAVSIDKAWRLEYERHKGKKIWSPTEQLLDAQVDQLRQMTLGFKTDVLLTHDCSNRTPWRNRLKPDIDSQIHRQRIDEVLGFIEPDFHFHGHMHERYDWQNRVSGDKWTQTYGLECNSDNWSWGIFDLKTKEFTWSVDVLKETGDLYSG